MGSAYTSRAAGIVLHPTSLPGRFGIGDLGPGAEAFIRWAAAAGQNVWQILPLGPTGDHNPPYACLSAFAGNPLLISPEKLRDDGLLPAGALDDAPTFNEDHVEFDRVIAWKERILRASWAAFRQGAPEEIRRDHRLFVEDPSQEEWLSDWALFTALKARTRGQAWPQWSDPLRRRDTQALAAARDDLRDDIDFAAYVQFLFFRQWSRLHAYAREHRLRVMGDLPIYVSLDSADVWSRPHLFQLDEDLRPIVVSGVPPDAFSDTGQLWGNPLYRWDRMEQEGYGWWISRLRMNLRLADLVRIDHFRGFAGYWEVPAGERTAIHGRWIDGPGERLFEALRGALGELEIVAEDLGHITEDVHRLRDLSGLPGMKVLQFAFGDDDSEHLPHHHTARCVVYTGTHDNDTTRGWFATLDDAARSRATEYLGARPETIEWDMIRAAYVSAAFLAIVPAQDVFGLGSEARMNTPGKIDGNWTWRARQEHFRDDTAARLRRLALLTGRLRR